MDVSKVSERTRQQLEALPPEKRGRAEAAIARTQTPEYRAREAAEREALDREYRETGRIATVGEAADSEAIKVFLSSLRREREARGLSLCDVAGRSLIAKANLSRLECGQQPNPTLATVARYARAIGKRLVLSLEERDDGPRGDNSDFSPEDLAMADDLLRERWARNATATGTEPPSDGP